MSAKTKPRAYKSDITGKEYPYDEYCGHGYGGIKIHTNEKGITTHYKDLPHDEYPYSILYYDPVLPAWMI